MAAKMAARQICILCENSSYLKLLLVTQNCTGQYLEQAIIRFLHIQVFCTYKQGENIMKVFL